MLAYVHRESKSVSTECLGLILYTTVQWTNTLRYCWTIANVLCTLLSHSEQILGFDQEAADRGHLCFSCVLSKHALQLSYF